ncbi:MAG: hypothetical protein WDZ79_01290 [Candidatus Paceibacterota bacterium]
MSTRTIKQIKELIRTKNLDLYGYHGTADEIIRHKEKGRITFFTETPGRRGANKSELFEKTYCGATDVQASQATVCFLDGRAVKTLFAGLPDTPTVFLIRVALNPAWILGFPGLLRRILRREFAYTGILTYTTVNGPERWVVLTRNRTKKPYSDTGYSLSTDIGVQGLLNRLRTEKMEYVVARFFENLPDLYRAGGDLDLLVSDTDETKLKDFLSENPGSIKVDVWTQSRPNFHNTCYFVPHLATQILASAIDGPGGSRVPAPKEAFLCFVYHCVYHKGYITGIPSRHHNEKVSAEPENDYAGKISEMARELGFAPELTLEGLDEFLASQGWRPKLDTLVRLARANEWINDHYFSHPRSSALGVFILKEKAIRANLLDPITNILLNDGYLIIRTKHFSSTERANVATHLRGGVWKDPANPNGSDGDLPEYAILVADPLPSSGVINRIRRTKQTIRKRFDEDAGPSVVHSTDTEIEAWEYIDVCFGDVQTVRQEIQAAAASARVSRKARLTHRINEIIFSIGKTFEGWRQTAKKRIRALGRSLAK